MLCKNQAIGLLVIALSGCGSLSFESKSEKPSLPPVTNSLITPADPSFDTLGIVAYAASMQGKPYRIAGANPEQGFDCSGLVQYVFGRFNIALPRSADAIAASLPKVDFASTQAADLIFFDTGSGPYSHVGIYLGDGRFVHAPSPQTGHVIISQLSNIYWRNRISEVHRPRLLGLAANNPNP